MKTNKNLEELLTNIKAGKAFLTEPEKDFLAYEMLKLLDGLPIHRAQSVLHHAESLMLYAHKVNIEEPILCRARQESESSCLPLI